MHVAPGAHIELRDTIWRVVRVDAGPEKGQDAWHCVGVSDLVRDQDALFLQALEPDCRVLDPRETRLVRDASSYYRAGLLHIESMLREVPPTDDDLYIGHRAVMDSLPFQLEPAALALRRPRARILIADAVGLGKTLEAGILLSELIRRGQGRRILTVTTRAMLAQFQKEMWCRFTIPLVRLDSDRLHRVRARIPLHHNPFHHYDRAIISIDTLKENNVFRRHVESARWDVVVIDEAHNVAVRGGRASLRAQVARVLAQRCDHLLLLSATPHDGRRPSLASLMDLLDPTAIADVDTYTRDDIAHLYVRRFKHQVAAQLAGKVPERTVERPTAQASAAEEAAFDVLTRTRLRAFPKGRGDVLFTTLLTKALFSSPAACSVTLASRLKELGRKLADLDDPAKRAKVKVARADVEHDIEALEAVKAAVDAIDPKSFSRYQRFLAYLRDELKWKPRAKDDRIVVFSERIDTLNFLAERLPQDLKALKLKPEHIRVMNARDLGDIEQMKLVEAFGQESAAVRILLATDVASEGLNLHFLCHKLVHFDVPWSLMVFQQRNGRVDRYGQTRPPRIAYLFTESVNPRIRGDQRILEVLTEKDDQAQHDIDDPSALSGYDPELEEDATARAMEAGASSDAFAADLDGGLYGDLFDALLGDAPEAEAVDVTTRDAVSLFGKPADCDFAYAAAGLDHLRGAGGPKVKVRDKDRLIELQWTRDLARRFARLPDEVLPGDGWALLTSDPKRMEQALADARRREDAWPTHWYLWRHSPLLEWLGDRVRAFFGRHAAPVLRVGEPLSPTARVVLASGLLPNQRSQPLVHRWWAVHLAPDDTVQTCEPFDDFQARVRLGATKRGNPDETIDAEALRRTLLPPAVAAVEAEMAAARAAFADRVAPRLQAQLARLEAARDARLSAARGEAAARRLEQTFADYQTWIRDAMTPAEQPFVQIVAVLLGAGVAA